MKVTIEVDCTPAEARAFLGLPDLTPLNEAVVDEMVKRTQSNMNALQPDELMKNWLAWGGQAQDQFRRMMGMAAGAATGPADRK
jgi:Family of unknown function (DUF6489)